MGRQAVHDMLHRSEPAPVQFANRTSCHIHKQFVSEQIEELLKVGSLVEWTGSQSPIVINGMGVVKNRKGKLRLVLDCRYVNMFVNYEHFTYETLADVTEYLHQGDWFVLTDAKSGYHHIRMHASSLPYFAIEFEGRLLAYPVTPEQQLYAVQYMCQQQVVLARNVMCLVNVSGYASLTCQMDVIAK